MKIENTSTQYFLTAEAVDQIAEQIESFLYGLEMERANVLRIRLSLEEALLRWMDWFGEDVEVVLDTGSHWRNPFLRLELAGEDYDPLSNAETDLGEWSETLLGGIGLSPRYSYHRGVNILYLRLRRPRRNPAYYMLLSLGIGLLVGLAGIRILPESVQSALILTILDPIEDVFFRILNATAGPVIFCTVLMAICGAGSVAASGKMGRKMLARFVTISTILAVCALVGSALLFSLDYHSTTMNGNRISNVLDFFLQIIPNDVLTPFINGDTPQLLLVAVILGNAILVTGTHSGGLTALIQQLNAVGMVLADWVGRISPFFIAILLILGLWNHSLQAVVGIWKPLLLFFALTILSLAAWMLRVSVSQKVPLKKLAKKMRPSFLVALRTASVDAAFGDNQLCCEKRLGVSRESMQCLPMGTILYMPASTIATMTFTLYAAKCYGITISEVWCVTALALTVTVIMASPPVAGIGLLAYAAIFTRLGIPSDGLTIALMADIMFGFFCAAGNQAMLQLELVLQSSREGKLSLKTLRK